MKFLIHGCFDVLHPGDREFISKMIKIFGEDLVIGVWENQRIAERKGATSPLFDLQWRRNDIEKYFPDAWVVELKQEYWKNGYIWGMPHYKMTVISLRPQSLLTPEQKEKTFTHRLEQNGYPILYVDPGDSPYHTSSVLERLKQEENMSRCTTKQVGAVLLRDGVIIHSSHNLGIAEECPRCQFNQQYKAAGVEGLKPPCNNLHAEEGLAKYIRPGDDVFISYAPCRKCAQLLVDKQAGRVVFMEDQWEGKVSWPRNFRRAGYRKPFPQSFSSSIKVN